MAGTMEHESATETDDGAIPWAQSSLEELPVAICVSGVSHAVMLASPYDLEDFARGFALSEGLIADFGELLDLEVRRDRDGGVIDLVVSSRAEQRLRIRRRTLTGRTGCGLCGVEALADAIPALNTLPAQRVPAAALIERARVMLPNLQLHNRRCGGGLHAAVLYDVDGTALLAREDIGRHNALDKLIGARCRPMPPGGFVILTSRCSFELVMKAARAGIGVLVTLAAPTQLAVSLARQANINLCCYRGRVMHCYHLAREQGKQP